MPLSALVNLGDIPNLSSMAKVLSTGTLSNALERLTATPCKFVPSSMDSSSSELIRTRASEVECLVLAPCWPGSIHSSCHIILCWVRAAAQIRFSSGVTVMCRKSEGDQGDSSPTQFIWPPSLFFDCRGVTTGPIKSLQVVGPPPVYTSRAIGCELLNYCTDTILSYGSKLLLCARN